jgi:hypothetical protein
MRSFVLRIIVIEHCSARGCPLEEASEHCFLSIKVLFWCCGFIYCVVPCVILCNISVFSYYNRSSTLQVVSEHFPWQKIVGYFFQGRDIF